VRSTPTLVVGVVGGGLVLVAAVVLWPTVGAVLLALAWASLGLALVAVVRRVRTLPRDARQARASTLKPVGSTTRTESAEPAATAIRADLGVGGHATGPWTREATLSGRYTPRQLSDFVAPSEPVAWSEENPFLDRPRMRRSRPSWPASGGAITTGFPNSPPLPSCTAHTPFESTRCSRCLITRWP